MSETTTKGRRHFLKTAAVTGGAAAAAAGGAAVADMTPEPAAQVPGASSAKKGYHVTPHIETFYRLARD